MPTWIRIKSFETFLRGLNERVLVSISFDGVFTTTARTTSFELNQPAAKGASVLLARRNFGSGSSREHRMGTG